MAWYVPFLVLLHGFLLEKGSQENEPQMAKILKKSRASIPKLSVFIGQKPIFCHCCIQNGKGGIQILVYKINNESLAHFSQFISVKV